MTLLLVFLIGVAAGGAAGVLLMALAAVADRASVSFGPRAEGVPAKSSGESPAAPSGAQQGPHLPRHRPRLRHVPVLRRHAASRGRDRERVQARDAAHGRGPGRDCRRHTEVGMEEDVSRSKLRSVSASQLAEILSEHRKWLAGDGGTRAYLHGSDLSGSDLSGSNLSGSNLRRSDLSDSNLSGSNLSDSDLSDSDLRYSDLRYSDLSRSDLRRSNLSDSDLSHSDLSGSNLSGSDLRRSDLHGSNLSGSNLSGSNLSDSNLSDSNLSGSTGLLDASQWIAENLTRCRGGVYAYKSFGAHYEPPADWRQEPGAEISETVNLLPTLDCACGVNVATLDWVRNNSNDAPIWKVLVRWEWMAGGVIPYNTDGKFRVPRAKLIEIVVPGEETS